MLKALATQKIFISQTSTAMKNIKKNYVTLLKKSHLKQNLNN